MYFVVYPPGSCGNMVSAVIDSTGLISGYRHVTFESDKLKLLQQQYRDAMTDSDRDEYVQYISEKYLSVPSHSFEYHVKRKHDFIFLLPNNIETIEWTIQRIQDILPDTNEYLTLSFVTNIINFCKPHANKIIYVEDILEGKLIEKLKEFIQTPLNEEFYFAWLSRMKKVYPIGNVAESGLLQQS